MARRKGWFREFRSFAVLLVLGTLLAACQTTAQNPQSSVQKGAPAATADVSLVSLKAPSAAQKSKRSLNELESLRAARPLRDLKRSITEGV